MTAAAAREVARGSGAAMGSEVVDSEAEVDWEMADWGAAAAANESGGRSANRLGRSFVRKLGLGFTAIASCIWRCTPV